MDLSIVIPFYNEEDNVKEVLTGISSAFKHSDIRYEIVAVNNGSLDRTGAILEACKDQMPFLKIVAVQVNQGYGWGIINGLKASDGEYIGFMCGDNQVDPSAILDVYTKAKRDNLDLCKVRRVERHDGFSRRLVSFFYNIICPALFLIRQSDLNGTPKIFRRSLLEKFNPGSKRWFIDGEIMIKCSRLRLKVGDVPIVFKKREKGSSKINIKAVVDFSMEMLSYRFRHL